MFKSGILAFLMVAGSVLVTQSTARAATVAPGCAAANCATALASSDVVRVAERRSGRIGRQGVERRSRGGDRVRSHRSRRGDGRRYYRNRDGDRHVSRRWRHDRYDRRHGGYRSHNRYRYRHRYYDDYGGVGVGFYAPWFTTPYYGYYGDDYGYDYYGYSYAPPASYVPAPQYGLAGTAAWRRACARKYKSFNPRTGLYLGYSGKYRRCRLP